MPEPIIAQKFPYVLELKPGSYWWCRCGRSGNQPFCDGSHRGSTFEPMKLEITDSTKVALCGCKKTANKPYCDGSHNKLD